MDPELSAPIVRRSSCSKALPCIFALHLQRQQDTSRSLTNSAVNSFDNRTHKSLIGGYKHSRNERYQQQQWLSIPQYRRARRKCELQRILRATPDVSDFLENSKFPLDLGSFPHGKALRLKNYRKDQNERELNLLFHRISLSSFLSKPIFRH
jgi:hypothetical protein